MSGETLPPIHCPIASPFTDESDRFSDELDPIVDHLQGNAAVTTETTFPRGSVTPDGRLDMCKQSIGAAGCRRISTALAGNGHISSLLLGTDGIGDQGARDVAALIRENQRLETIYLGCNAITELGAESVAEAVRDSSTVRGLWLKRNPIGDYGAQAIARMLRINTSLKVLDLVNTNIGMKGISAILDALVDWNGSLEHLYLGGNNLGVEHAHRIAELLRRNTSIKRLLLNVGRLGDEGAGIIAEGLRYNRTLIELGVASNGIGPNGGAAIVRGVAEHPALRHLDLGYSFSTHALGASPNALADQGAREVAALIRTNVTLRRIDLRGNGITEVGIAFLIDALDTNTTLRRVDLDEPVDSRIADRLARNAAVSVDTDELYKDVAMIRSVYRGRQTGH